MGQHSIHFPHSMQASVITYCSSPSMIAETGQLSTQIPHFTHSEVIIKVISKKFPSNTYSLAISTFYFLFDI